MQLSQRTGQSRDHGFICSSLLNGARKGHFAIRSTDKDINHHLKRQVAQVLAEQERGQKSGIDIVVYWQNQLRVGFSIVVDIDGLPGGRELHVIAVDRKYHGQGLGSVILDATLTGLIKTPVHARCAASSSRMYEMLLRRGFIHLRDTQDRFRVLKRLPVL